MVMVMVFERILKVLNKFLKGFFLKMDSLSDGFPIHKLIVKYISENK